jgi:predicted  nucleic acid-binding Zn-ribbon protein
MMESHEERAAEAEYEIAEMEEESDRLSEDIESAKDDWQRKRQDSSVPGAAPADDDDGESGD